MGERGLWFIRSIAVAHTHNHAVSPAILTRVAQAYAGHPFSGFSAQLGDGRAVLLGELIDRLGKRVDIALKGSGRAPFARREALLRTPLKDLLVQLNPVQFQQAHRSVIVASSQIASAVRDDAGGMVLKPRGCPDQLTVSRPFQGAMRIRCTSTPMA
ncbi:MAG: hypothetical protein RL500_2393 [Pseudomonadota bacterium]|jgi:hypothetical protein